MPRSLRLCVAVLVAAGFAALSSRASADQITLTLGSQYTPVTYNPNGGTAVTLNAGPFNWTQTTPINTNYATALTTYCIDTSHFITAGSTYTFTADSNLSLAPTIGGSAAKVSAIDALFNKYYGFSLTNATDEAAFQLALWKLVYDGPSSSQTSLNSGTIQLAGDTSTTPAQELLNGTLPSSANDLANAHLVALVSGTGNQDQIFVQPNPPVAGVPAPPAVVLAGVGALVLLGRARLARRAA
jgi:hypothetical protein